MGILPQEMERMVAEPCSIFIVEDHLGMLQALRQLLEEVPEFTVIGYAASAEVALVQLAVLSPDLCLVDLSLPGMSGLELVEYLSREQPSLRCLVVTGHSDPMYRLAALTAGAAGYVTKDDPDNVLLAVREVLA